MGYWHPNSDADLPWLRHRVVPGEPRAPRLGEMRRIAQLTGEYAGTRWDGNGTPPFAHNGTESAYQIRGTDLGVSFAHRDRTDFPFAHRDRTDFPFGETWRNNQPAAWTNYDLVISVQDIDHD